MNKHWNRTSKPWQREPKLGASRNQNKPQKGGNLTLPGAKKINEMDAIPHFDHEAGLPGSFKAKDIKFYAGEEKIFARRQEENAKLPSGGKQKNFRHVSNNITRRFSSNRTKITSPPEGYGSEEPRKRSTSEKADFSNRNVDVFYRKNSKSPVYAKPQPQFILKDSKIMVNPGADETRREGRKTRITPTSYTPSVGKVPTQQRPIEYYRINRYISQSGLCSRRQADQLIKEGRVKINGQVCTELATRVLLGKDQVTVNNKTINQKKWFICF
jgi:ribosome-associated protein YbcJ (S4-like RNA binding protein)